MPEAAVNEHGNLLAFEYDVGSAGKALHVLFRYPRNPSLRNSPLRTISGTVSVERLPRMEAAIAGELATPGWTARSLI